MIIEVLTSTNTPQERSTAIVSTGGGSIREDKYSSVDDGSGMRSNHPSKEYV